MQYSDIYGFNRIYSYGFRSLTNAYMNTTDIEKPIVVFGGYYTTYDATFICASGSTCYIYCVSDTGCKNLDVFNYGTVSTSCDTSWQSCPNVTDEDFINQEVLAQELQERQEYRLNEMDIDAAKEEILRHDRNDKQDLHENMNDYFFTDSEFGFSDIMNNSHDSKVLVFGIIAGILVSALLFAAYTVFGSKFMAKKNEVSYQSLH